MDAADVRPDNLHIAVALLLEGQQAQMRTMKDMGDTLADVKAQVYKTNGRVNAHDQQLARLAENACPQPGACTDLQARVRSLEDDKIKNQGRAEGVIFAGKAIHWLAGGSVVAIATAVAKMVGLL